MLNYHRNIFEASHDYFGFKQFNWLTLFSIRYLADVQVQAQEGVIHVALEWKCTIQGSRKTMSREDGLEISIESQCPEEISRKKGKPHTYMKRSIISGSLHHTSHDIWIILSILWWSKSTNGKVIIHVSFDRFFKTIYNCI